MAKTDIEEIAAQFRPSLQASILAAFNELRNQNSIKVIAEIYELGGVDAVLGTIQNMNSVLSQHVLDGIDAAVLAGGRTAIQFIPAAGIVIQTYKYDTFHQPTVDFLRRYRLNLINGISNETRSAVQNTLIDQAISGANPVRVATEFRGTIGLTVNQEKAVASYRTALENLDRSALGRKLRDGRFDRAIINAIDNDTPLTPEQIDRYVNRYRERYIKYRSEVIARTESLRAVSIGQDESLKQMMEQGVLDDGLRQFWIYAKDGRTRRAHRLIPSMNNSTKNEELGTDGTGIPMTAMFQTPLGPLKYPRDPDGTSANTIQCRCRRVFRLI